MTNSNITSFNNNSTSDPTYERDARMYYIFYGSNLTNITLPKNMTSIPTYQFAYCKKLKYVTFQEGLTTIYRYAFYNCTSLESIVLPATVTTIEYNAFDSCMSLTTFDASNSTLTVLNSNMFSACYSLVNVLLPNTINTFNSYVFSNCIKLENIKLPDSLVTISYYAFNNCINLKHVTMDTNKLKSIDYYAFNQCPSLVEIPSLENVTTLSYYVFRFCRNLELTIAPNVNVSYNSSAYMSTGAQIIIPADIKLSTTLNLDGAQWKIKNFLKFIETLPDRTGETAYTVSLGTDIDISKIWSTSENISRNKAWNLYKNGYVGYVNDEFVYSDTQEDPTFVKVSDYVAAKNWTLTE